MHEVPGPGIQVTLAALEFQSQQARYDVQTRLVAVVMMPSGDGSWCGLNLTRPEYWEFERALPEHPGGGISCHQVALPDHANRLAHAISLTPPRPRRHRYERHIRGDLDDDGLRGAVDSPAVSTADDTAYRTDPPQVGDERAMLAGWLAYQRGTLLWKCAGLTGAELSLATAEPSTMTLLGLVRHLTEVERYWFQICVAGRPLVLRLWTDEHPDGDFDLLDADRAVEDLGEFKTVAVVSDQIANSFGLDHVFRRPNRDGEWSLRWLYMHLNQEYSRHNGHADLIRERLDGVTGE
ncbi:MAG: hypothetical protein QOG10_3705 [Kribbellaceae bacterium]|nr:hypothetical protein [Kribbellaceae bacterium]